MHHPVPCLVGHYFREKVEREFSTPFDLKAAKQQNGIGDALVNISN